MCVASGPNRRYLASTSFPSPTPTSRRLSAEGHPQSLLRLCLDVRGADGGGDARWGRGRSARIRAVRRAWAGSCGPVHPAGSRWNESDLSTGVEGRAPHPLSLSEWLALVPEGRTPVTSAPCSPARPLPPTPAPGRAAARAASLQNSVPTFPRDVACFGIRRAWF